MGKLNLKFILWNLVASIILLATQANLFSAAPYDPQYQDLRFSTSVYPPSSETNSHTTTSSPSTRPSRPTFAPYDFVPSSTGAAASIALNTYERSLWEYHPDSLPRRQSANTGRLEAAVSETTTVRLNDYVESEEDFQNILDNLRREAEEGRIIDDRDNYLDDDADIEAILRRIAEQEQHPREAITFNQMTTFVPQYFHTEHSTPPSADASGEVSEAEICSICLDSIEYSNGVTLNCLHNFHMECIDEWLRQKLRNKPGCPVCRKPVQADNQHQ